MANQIEPTIDEYLRKRLMPVEGAIPHLDRTDMYGDSIPAGSVGVTSLSAMAGLTCAALDGQTLVVVEVRSTASDDLEATAASVDARKQRKITEAALRFLARRRLLGRIAVRFDVLALSWPDTVREPVVRHIRHAFEAVGRFQMFN